MINFVFFAAKHCDENIPPIFSEGKLYKFDSDRDEPSWFNEVTILSTEHTEYGSILRCKLKLKD